MFVRRRSVEEAWDVNTKRLSSVQSSRCAVATWEQSSATEWTDAGHTGFVYTHNNSSLSATQCKTPYHNTIKPASCNLLLAEQGIWFLDKTDSRVIKSTTKIRSRSITFYNKNLRCFKFNWSWKESKKMLLIQLCLQLQCRLIYCL